NDPTVGAMTKAAREALGEGANVMVRDLPRGMSDDDAVALGRTLRADAVVEIVWTDGTHQRVRVHLHSEKRARWLDREIGFDEKDADAERGRTIGFTVASMIPERASGASTSSSTSTPTPTPTSTSTPTSKSTSTRTASATPTPKSSSTSSSDD